ncbi:hypothetical protein P4S72_30160 [Vibrio sp. PP-XX7]
MNLVGASWQDEIALPHAPRVLRLGKSAGVKSTPSVFRLLKVPKMIQRQMMRTIR